MTIMSIVQWLQHYWIAVVFVVFSVLLATTYWPGRRASIERHGRIPLDD
jgi:cbb3-type cytochrome oxidase subunit 3